MNTELPHCDHSVDTPFTLYGDTHYVNHIVLVTVNELLHCVTMISKLCSHGRNSGHDSSVCSHSISKWFKANHIDTQCAENKFCVFNSNHQGMNIIQDVSLSTGDSIPRSEANVVILPM